MNISKLKLEVWISIKKVLNKEDQNEAKITTKIITCT